jgi:hypothetical protein
MNAPTTCPSATIVVASCWRALPDAFDPPDIEMLCRRAESEGCALITTITPEQGGFRHKTSMVPRTEEVG